MVVCNLHLEKEPGPTQTCRTRRSYRIKWEALADKDVRKTFAGSVSALFRELPECTVDAKVECQLIKVALLLGYVDRNNRKIPSLQSKPS